MSTWPGPVLEREGEETLKVIAYYAEHAKEYDEGYEDPFWRIIYDGITWHHVEAWLPREGLALDAGGGTGRWALRMAGARPGLSLVLLDISREMLMVAKRKLSEAGLLGRVALVEADICAMPFRPSVFDFALAEGDPISYCEDPKEAVRELFRVLKPGACAQAGVDSLFRLIRTLLARGQIEEARRVLEKSTYTPPDWGFRWWLFTPESLRELFEQAGFRVLKVVGKPVVSVPTEELKKALEDQEAAKRVVEVELALCSEPSIVGLGGHLHVVAVKPGG